ncbi:MAG TPA: shikimate dehydrogenase [Thermomicrobiales bacterium]|nr:shikimate dehydrogenase [Thermomicrobiales bacterium]
MRRAGLIGNPVAHSRSPLMHNAAFAALGIDATYELWLTEESEIPERVGSLRQPDSLGANVTVPHKQAVMPHCDRLTETARRIGAVNTIIPRDGELLGDNTDAFGFAQSVREAAGQRVFRHALVLGAGGAARAVIVSLQDLGVGRITIANRTLAKAQELASELSAPGLSPLEGIALSSIDDGLPPTVDLLVNSTSIGWHGDETPVPVELLATLDPAALVVDLTYRETALLRDARENGNAVIDGSGMLLHQGVRAFELWTGQPAPVDLMREALFSSP